MATTSLADVKNRLSEIIASAEKTHERTVITKNGRPVAILLSVEDYQGMEETLDILSDPREAAELREAIVEADAGGITYTLGEVRLMMDRRASGSPMTDAEMEDLVVRRIGREAFEAATARAAEALDRHRSGAK